jgi:hypothetical protein
MQRTFIETAGGDVDDASNLQIRTTPSHVEVRIKKDLVPDEILNTKKVNFELSDPPPEIKAAFEAQFGSMENLVAQAITSPEFWSTIVNFWRMQPSDPSEETFQALVATLADVGKWKTLASTDPRTYRAELAASLSAYKSELHKICKNPNHRPRNRKRNSLIREIRDSHPDWSFGKVANAFNRKTGEKIDAGTAERIYSRETTAVIRLGLH